MKKEEKFSQFQKIDAEKENELFLGITFPAQISPQKLLYQHSLQKIKYRTHLQRIIYNFNHTKHDACLQKDLRENLNRIE